jgi:hypothetical protein
MPLSLFLDVYGCITLSRKDTLDYAPVLFDIADRFAYYLFTVSAITCESISPIKNSRQNTKNQSY